MSEYLIFHGAGNLTRLEAIPRVPCGESTLVVVTASTMNAICLL